jgi:hypothetical protein
MELAPFFTKFYAFFKKYFSEHMEDNKPSGEPPAPSAPQELLTSDLTLSCASATLLSALNYLLQTCAMDEGSRARQLGTELHATFLKRWDTRQQLLKEQIVYFFRLQLLLHTSFTGKILSTANPAVGALP